MHEFFNSVGRAFARNRQGIPHFIIALFLLLLGIVVFNLVAALRRRARERAALEAFATRLGLSPSDLTLICALAQHVPCSPQEVMLRLDVFEQVTAEFLHGRPHAPKPGQVEQVRTIRKQLGFAEPPATGKLLSTREFKQGIRIAAGAGQGVVTAVDEETFVAEFEGVQPPPAGTALVVTVLDTAAAQYQCRCEVVKLEPQGDPTRVHLVFSHDEHPQRQQLREFLRVESFGRATLRSALNTRSEVVAHLQDLSGGGARLSSPRALTVGETWLASFTVDGEAFTDVACVVISSQDQDASGSFETRVRFVGMSERAQEQLLSALIRLDAHQVAARKKE